jgi:hypothetical protein
MRALTRVALTASLLALAAGATSGKAAGIEPVSIAVHDHLVYVANAGAGGSNYTGFTFNPGGHLRTIAGSTVSLPDGCSLGDVLSTATARSSSVRGSARL